MSITFQIFYKSLLSLIPPLSLKYIGNFVKAMFDSRAMFLNLSRHQNHLEDLLKWIPGSHTQTLSFHRSGMRPENLLL